MFRQIRRRGIYIPLGVGVVMVIYKVFETKRFMIDVAITPLLPMIQRLRASESDKRTKKTFRSWHA
jgi:hypothetical protein